MTRGIAPCCRHAHVSAGDSRTRVGPACRPAPAEPRPERAGSADIHALVERVAPSVLALLADGVPRTKGAIVQALARRHGAEAVALALIRLSVTGEVEQSGGKYALATGDAGPPATA